MSAILPFALIGMAGAALFAGVYSLWASFRAAFGALDVPDLQGTVEAVSRRELLEEKQTLLENLKDLRFDRDAGKLSQKDFERLDATWRERAKEVLRLLDADVEPFRKKAEALVEERLKAKKGSPYRKKSKPALSKKDCPSCATKNDADAAFCKKCGFSFDEGDAVVVEKADGTVETMSGEMSLLEAAQRAGIMRTEEE
ncbi:MAG: zinc ribbon domain-containing protein [Myxococcota bacterium]